MSKAKCKFRVKAVEYMGHRIDGTGLYPTEKNLEAIIKAPELRNVSEMCSFFCMLTFYSRFLPNLSARLFPLYKLLEKGSDRNC